MDSSLPGNLFDTNQVQTPEGESHAPPAVRSFRHLGFRAIAVLLGIALAFL